MKNINISMVTFLLCIVHYTNLQAASVDFVFLGVLGNNVQAIEKTFDDRIRSALSVSTEYQLADYTTSQDFRRKINFDNYTTVSRKLIESLRQFSSDSTIFMWVSIKKQDLRPVRKWIISSDAVCELTLLFHVYSLRYKEFAFIGDVSVQKSKYKGMIFFYPLENGVHITSLDRDELLTDCIDSAANKTSDLISTLIQHEKAQSMIGVDTTTTEINGLSRYKAPSISDMFNLPSVEAATVGNRKKATPIPEGKPVSPTTDQKKTKP